MMVRYRLRRLEALLQRVAPGRGRSAVGPRRLQTVQDVLDVLQEQVEALRADPGVGAVEKARAIGYLAGAARKTMEAGTLAARLEMLEAVLHRRHEESKR